MHKVGRWSEYDCCSFSGYNPCLQCCLLPAVIDLVHLLLSIFTRKEQRKQYIKSDLQTNTSQEAGIRKRSLPFLLSFARKWGEDVVLPEQGNGAGKACYWDAKLALWRTESDIYTDSLSSSPISHVPHLTAHCFGLSPAAAEGSRNRGLLKLSAQPGKAWSVETGWRNSPGYQVSVEL